MPATLLPSSTPEVLAQACPEANTPGVESLLTEGTFLFNDISSDTKVGLWGLSASDTLPRLIYALSDNYRFNDNLLVSPKGDKIAWTDLQADQKTLTIYDLFAQRAETYDLPRFGNITKEWSEENRIILYSLDKDVDKGSEARFLDFDLLTQGITMETFPLPKYVYFPGDQWEPFETFFAPDPARKLALYTAFGDTGTAIVLYDLQDQQVLWSASLNGFPFLAEPDWSEDGTRAALSMPVPDEGDEHKLFTLSHEGQLEELGPQPATIEETLVVRFLKWSPNARYLFYALGKSVPNIDGPGYILDTLTSEIKPVCNPSEGQFLNGIWAGNANHLFYFYAIRLHPGKLQYWLLDAQTGKGQLLAETDEFFWFPSLAWTPLELP